MPFINGQIMIEILQNKNSTTRFQIMVEIASTGPNIYQRTIAAKLGISPQAVSEYIRQLTEEEMIIALNRSSYRISVKGVNWMLKMLRELSDYKEAASKAIAIVTTCAAIAENDLKKGQPVGLKMKEGMLYASGRIENDASGVAVNAASKGEDVGISNIEGIVKLTQGMVTILEIPSIQDGGSGRTDLKKLKKNTSVGTRIGAIGIEALAALKKVEKNPDYLFGVAEAAIEETKCGLSFTIVCTSDAIAGLIKKLQESDREYISINMDIKKKKSTSSH
jgi:putative transcriptional regulator